ncbi:MULTISPECIES: GAF domain-containing sensor histidine kinase [Limnospira]|nr:ATP-binding protein [Arthrospira platensis]MDT9182274.1 ATP-binding protein [Limnospira sp. PMC 289.06]
MMQKLRNLNQKSDWINASVWKDIEQEMLLLLNPVNSSSTLFDVHCFQLILCYLFRDYESALQAAELVGNYIDDSLSIFNRGEYLFYYSLTLVAKAETLSGSKRDAILEKIRTNQGLMSSWNHHIYGSFKHRYILVEAELERLSNQILSALQKYEQAVSEVITNGAIHEIAIAYELAAEFYKQQNLERFFVIYIKAAHGTYSRWEATAKVKDIKYRYPDVFSPANWWKSSVSQSREYPSNAQIFNLGHVLQAYQTLSGETVLASLLAKTMKIIIENTDAEIGYLILPCDHKSSQEISQEWMIEAMAEMDIDEVTVLRSIPLNTLSDKSFPKSIINYVARTHEYVLLNNAYNHQIFRDDEYIKSHKPKSILGIPLIRQKRLIGIFYLEKNMTNGSFEDEQIQIVSLLSVQVAISLENALLYRTLQQKVTEQNAELSQTSQRLKTVQKRLIEAEKMATLGGLVAGVAHEINTPVGTGIMAASFLVSETKKFLSLCQLQPLKRSALNMYLDIVLESSKLILSNLQRSAELVQSFQQVAVDQTSLERRTFTLRPYLEEILLNIRPKLKQTHHRIVVEGDDTIEVDSYPGAISQVITNLVINSLIHAYQPSESGQLYLKIAEVGDDHFLIEYSDDGCGILSENLEHIFDPFFTTTRNHGGNGLGLHIVYNLVTKTLKGTISCDSQVGVGSKFIINCPRRPST